MNKGVTLLAIGSDAYRMWAINMACTLKYFAPDLLIQLVASAEIKQAILNNGEEKLFDYMTIMDSGHYETKGVLAPGKAKLALPSYFLFEQTLYLDTDGIVLKDVRPVFDTDAPLVMHINDWFTLGETERPASMAWCNSSVIMQHYGYTPDVKLPALNSSCYLYTDTLENKTLFQLAYHYITTDPIPKEKYFQTWGKGTGMDPDELYLNCAIAALGVQPLNEHFIYFRDAKASGKALTANEIKDKHYGIGLYGGENYNHVSLKNIYDAVARPAYTKAFPLKPFRKAHMLLPHKIVNQKF